jgi:uncharacterized protein (DUF4415 family)
MQSVAKQSASSVHERQVAMNRNTFVSYSPNELDEMIANGEDKTDYKFLETHEPDEDLPQDFWADAVLVGPKTASKSIHLRVAPEVFEFFVNQTGGKGHIAKMQAVLKAYADAHR